MHYDVIIVGAGPAGLAAAQRFSTTRLRCLMIDIGRRITDRDKDSESELTQGHGGAGLYSDGKFSFFPSASALWNLPNRDALRDAYEWTSNTLRSYGLDSPPLPTDPAAYTVGSGEWVLKDYPSDYLSLEARTQLTQRLVETASVDTLTRSYVSSYEYNSCLGHFDVVVKDLDSGDTRKLHSSRLFLASGRFGSLEFDRHTAKSFRRLEVGFRIEQPAEKAFFRTMKQLDPKLKFRCDSDEVEWRTFCACRNGATVLTRTLGLWTVSGHSDGPPTGRSNVGFNTRILSPTLADDGLYPLLQNLQNEEAYFSLPLGEVLQEFSAARSNFCSVYGPVLASKMLEGLKRLIDRFPEIRDSETRLIGPTLEGVGRYPDLDGHLKVPNLPIWVVGDACGLFRGIIAAFISGFYAADSLIRSSENQSLWQPSSMPSSELV